MCRLVFCFSALWLLVSCSSPESRQATELPTDSLPGAQLSTDQQGVSATTAADNIADPLAGSNDFSIEVFENKDGTGGFGYDLLNGGKVTIHQPHIPAVSGTSGFSSKEDAEKVGSLMLMKIQKGIMPPTITVEELDSLGIKH